MSDPEVKALDWDSSFFGFKIGRAVDKNFVPEDRTVVERAKEQGLRCVYFLVDAESPETLAAMHSFGCRFIDGRLCLSRSAGSEIESSSGRGDVRLADDADGQELVEISESIEWDTRFFKDSGFPVERSRQMYSKWIARDLNGGTVIVATDPQDGAISGFLSFRFDEPTRKAVIELLAVRESARGQGVADRLLSDSIRRIQSLKASEIDVITQSSNVPAQRLYQKHGFRSRSLELWFHLWL